MQAVPFGVLIAFHHLCSRASFPIVLKFLCTTAGLKEPNGMKYAEVFALAIKAMFYMSFIWPSEWFFDHLDK